MVEVFGNLFSGNIVKGSKFSYSQKISSQEHGSSRNHLLKFDLHSMGQLPVAVIHGVFYNREENKGLL